MWFFFSPEVGVLVNRVIKFYGQGVVLSLADCYFEIRNSEFGGHLTQLLTMLIGLDWISKWRE